MEKIIYSSCEKYKIIEIKEHLNKNNIPITSIQLYIKVIMEKHGRGNNLIDIREDRGELIVPIEEFNEILNDDEIFEIYTEEEYENEALKLIEEYSEENYYRNCIYKSNNFDEICNVQIFLRKNGIPCEEVVTNFLDNNEEEYLIFLNPEFKEKANELINNNYKKEVIINTDVQSNVNNSFNQDIKDHNPFVLISILIIIGFFIWLALYKSNINIVEAFNIIKEFVKNIKQ